MITARDEMDDRVAALEAGADDFIAKPFNVREVLARVKALLRRSQGFSSDVLQVGDLVLNGAERTCAINGTPLVLTVREFDLLECFMRHPRQALSRAQLIQHVWGDDYFGDENVVDVYVRYLRKKLEATGFEAEGGEIGIRLQLLHDRCGDLARCLLQRFGQGQRAIGLKVAEFRLAGRSQLGVKALPFRGLPGFGESPLQSTAQLSFEGLGDAQHGQQR